MSSHPELCSEVAGGVTRNIVCLFREPDAGNLPVRFDEREQETELRQTGLRRTRRKPSPIATGRLRSLRLFSTLLPIALIALGRGEQTTQGYAIASLEKSRDLLEQSH